MQSLQRVTPSAASIYIQVDTIDVCCVCDDIEGYVWGILKEDKNMKPYEHIEQDSFLNEVSFPYFYLV